MPKISIVTLTFNKPQLMISCINSVAVFCYDQDFEWIIINNDTVKTDEYKKRLEFHGIPGKVLEHDNTGCFSSMNNVAVNYASGEFVLFLNNDVMASSSFIEEQLKCFDDPSCKIAGAVLTYPDGSLQHAGVILTDNVSPANLGEEAIEKIKLDIKKVHPDNWEKPRPFFATTGACLMMRLEDFKKVGGFHEEFRWCFDDVDLCFRTCLYLDGYCLVPPKARLTHAESSSGGDRNVAINYEILRNRWCDLRPPDFHRFL